MLSKILDPLFKQNCSEDTFVKERTRHLEDVSVNADIFIPSSSKFWELSKD